MMQNWMAGILLMGGVAIIGSCETESARLADMAERTVELQSDQNTTVAKTAEELAKLNRDVQAERKELNQSFEKLETDRRELNRQRRSELAWAESFQFLAIVIAASLPLFLCAYLIWAATQNTNDAELVNEILLQELVSERPQFIAGPNLPAIKNDNSNSRSGEESLKLTNDTNTKGGTENDVTHSSDND